MNYSDFFDFLDERGLCDKLGELNIEIEKAEAHGDYNKFVSVLKKIPSLKPSHMNFNSDAVTIGKRNDLSNEEFELLREQLKALIPWRKGPYDLFGVFIDTEWRSDFKWNRLKDSLSPLKNRLVLDVGSGNGYHCWRMLGAGASAVIGIDPYLLSVVQFNAVKSYVPKKPVWVLPVGVEQMPPCTEVFDTVFSMGVLYHRRSPFDHIFQLKSFLKEGGELVLETLVIDGGKGEVLVPEERYAKMRNVWFIPSALTLESWLKRAGFKDIRLIDITVTTSAEQRKTEWMPWESLEEHLTKDKTKTIEGYPAPKRAIFICKK